MIARHGDAGLENASIVVALGGDGLMLETLHRVMDRNVPVYGMNFGTVGFLMTTTTPMRWTFGCGQLSPPASIRSPCG